MYIFKPPCNLFLLSRQIKCFEQTTVKKREVTSSTPSLVRIWKIRHLLPDYELTSGVFSSKHSCLHNKTWVVQRFLVEYRRISHLSLVLYFFGMHLHLKTLKCAAEKIKLVMITRYTTRKLHMRQRGRVVSA